MSLKSTVSSKIYDLNSLIFNNLHEYVHKSPNGSKIGQNALFSTLTTFD